MAPDRRRIVSFPGDNASSDWVVSTPYATANRAQTTATSAPWLDRKLDKRNLAGLRQSETAADLAAAERPGSLPRCRELLAGNPESARALGRAGLAGLRRLRLAARGRRLGGGRCSGPAGYLDERHLQLRERLLDLAEL